MCQKINRFNEGQVSRIDKNTTEVVNAISEQLIKQNIEAYRELAEDKSLNKK